MGGIGSVKKAHFFFCKLPDNVEAVVEITSLKEDITQLSKKDASESMQTLKTPTKLSPALGVISNDDYVVDDNNDSSSNNIDLKNCPRDKTPLNDRKLPPPASSVLFPDLHLKITAQ